MTRTVQHILDEWLVLRCQAGEAAALSELLSRWHRRLLEHARSLVRHDADAADATQDALMGIARSIHRLRDPSLFGPWACCIVAHKCADLIKRNQHARSVAAEAVSLGPVQSGRSSSSSPADAAAEEDAARLRLAISLLPLASQAILLMRYARDMSTQQIAAALALREGTVKSRLHHARNELKSILERTP